MSTKYAIEVRSKRNTEYIPPWVRAASVPLFDSMTAAEIYCIESVTSVFMETRVVAVSEDPVK